MAVSPPEFVPNRLTSASELVHRRRVTGSGVDPQGSPSRDVVTGGDRDRMVLGVDQLPSPNVDGRAAVVVENDVLGFVVLDVVAWGVVDDVCDHHSGLTGRRNRRSSSRGDGSSGPTPTEPVNDSMIHTQDRRERDGLGVFPGGAGDTRRNGPPRPSPATKPLG